MEWNQIIAAAINVPLVMALVQLLKVKLPVIDRSAPWLLPILAGAIGPAVAAMQNALGDALGVPVDLSPVVAVFTGSTAVAVHQVKKQAAAPKVKA